MCQQLMFYCQVMQELEEQEENERNKENEFPTGSMENHVVCECE